MDGDVIIIGSGIGGLIAGASLAKMGKRVLVFEQHSIPGGYATAFQRKKYRFEVSLHLLGDLDEGGMIHNIYEKIGILPSVKFYKVSALYKAVYPDYSLIARYNSDYITELQNLFPDEAEEIEELLDTFVKIRMEILLINKKSIQGEFINMPLDAPLVNKFRNLNLTEMLNEFLTSANLKSVISQYWLYFGLPPSKISAIFYAYVWTEYFLYGGFYPHDRSQAISDRLVEIIKSYNGEVHVKCKVKKIIVEDGKATGIELQNGEIYTSEYIISNADLKATFKDMVGYNHIKKRYINQIENVEPSISCVQVYLCLDIDLPTVYNEKNHEIFVNEKYDLEEAYADIIEDKIEEAPFAITIYDNIIKDYNEVGKSTLSIIQLSYYDNWHGLSMSKYKQKKERTMKCLVSRLEKIFPQITEHIVFKNISTPLTNERYTGNQRGAIYGAAQTVNQSLNKRISQ